MLSDKDRMEHRIDLLNSMNRNLQRELSMADLRVGITPRGRRISSVKGMISSNELEIRNLKQKISKTNIAR